MRYQITILIVCVSLLTSWAQTNTFPSSGNVGIGTTSPVEKLSVAGNIFLTGDHRQIYGPANNQYIDFRTGGVLGFHLGSDIGDIYGYSFYDKAGAEIVKIQSIGNVGIGTTSPDSKLSVKGTIHTQEVKVDLNGSVAPDYVFESDYPLTSLEELKSYINQNKRLPEIPSAKEMEEEGINLKEMNLLLLKKVEELTLHMLEQEKRIQTLEENQKQ